MKEWEQSKNVKEVEERKLKVKSKRMRMLMNIPKFEKPNHEIKLRKPLQGN